MENTMNAIEMKDFNLLGDLSDERDMLESFGEYSGYVCDAITELADSYIPIYNHDVWENVSDIQEYIEEAISEGIAPTEGEVDLVKIFQAGYYMYYSQSLYENLDTLAFNLVAEKVNEYLNADKPENVDLDEIVSAIESETENFDNNNQMDSINDIAKSIIEQIKNEEL